MKTLQTTLSTAAAAALLCSGVLAQTGADDCSMADPIAGLGSFPFDNMGATGASGSCTVNQDIWFVWTAPANGDFIFDTCGTATIDSKLAIYPDANCASADVDCNDDSCGLQSSVTLTGAVMGSDYLLQLGTISANNSTGTGMINVFTDPCSLATDDGLEDNDTCATAVVAPASSTALFVSMTDSDFYTVTVADTDTLTIDLTFVHALGDTDIFLYADQAACDAAASGSTAGALVFGFSATDNEQIMWTNTTGSTQTYWVRVEIYPFTGTGDCNTYDMIVDDGGGGVVGTSYCPSNPHSAGGPAVLSAMGDPNSSLVLISQPVPNTPGLFYFGPNQLNGTAFGNGVRCVGGSTTRMYPLSNGAANVSTFTIDYGAPYASGLTGTQNFQHWFRDGMGGGAGFNTSSGLSINF